jgi:hypothetical protein
MVPAPPKRHKMNRNRGFPSAAPVSIRPSPNPFLTVDPQAHARRHSPTTSCLVCDHRETCAEHLEKHIHPTRTDQNIRSVFENVADEDCRAGAKPPITGGTVEMNRNN